MGTYRNPSIRASGTTFAQFQKGGLTSILENLITANPALANPSVQATVVPTGGGRTLANPTTQATVSVTSGASATALPNGVYYVSYTFTHAHGETTVGTSESAPFTIANAPNNQPRVTLPSLPTGATGINIYLTVAGGAAGSETLYATGVTTTTYDLLSGTWAGTATVPAANTTAGALAAGTYYLSYTFFNGAGETTAGTSESASFTVASGNIPQVTLPSLPSGASGIRLYVTAVGGAAGSETLYTTGISTTTFDLTLNTWDNALETPPTSNTTDFSNLSGRVRTAEAGLVQRAWQSAADLVSGFLRGHPQAYADVRNLHAKHAAAIALLSTAMNEAGALIEANHGTLTTTAVGINAMPTPKRTFP